MIQQHNSLCQGEKKYIIGLKKKKSEQYFKIFQQENSRQLMDSTKYLREKDHNNLTQRLLENRKIFQVTHFSNCFYCVFIIFLLREFLRGAIPCSFDEDGMTLTQAYRTAWLIVYLTHETNYVCSLSPDTLKHAFSL